MRLPDVKNEYPSPVNGIKFVVTAYRKLTDHEMMQSIAYYFRSVKKPAKKGGTVTIDKRLHKSKNSNAAAKLASGNYSGAL